MQGRAAGGVQRHRELHGRAQEELRGLGKGDLHPAADQEVRTCREGTTFLRQLCPLARASEAQLGKKSKGS